MRATLVLPLLTVTAFAAASLEPLVERYSTDTGSLRSFYDTPMSETGLKRLERFYQEWQRQLGTVDYGRLAVDGAIDFHLLRNDVNHGLRQIAFQRKRNAETAQLTPFAQLILDLEEARWQVTPVDSRVAADRLTELTKAVQKVRKQVEAGLDAKAASADAIKVGPELGFRASGAVDSLASTLNRWFRHYDGFDPIFSWWAQKPYDAAKKELDDYAKLLRERVAGVKGVDSDPLIGDPIGREAILDDLRHEMISNTPEDLVEIANREFAWCEAEMKRAARDMGFGDDWKKALEIVKGLHVQPGEQDDLVVKQAREAIAFVDRHNLVTIEDICRETWRLEMLDERTQRVLPFAAYGGQKMLVAYPLDTMDHETKLMSLRGNNIHFSRIVTPHELIPGHHLQGYMAQRYRAYRRTFSTPFLGEGWALHWEMLLWDLKYPETPENRVGMLFWRMHRAARIIVSLQFHLGKMKPQEMIDFLVDRVGHERFTATSEVRRFIGGMYSPLYQCAYMIGGLQIRQLYKELVDTKKMTPKEFHDRILREGPIPIEMIKVALTGNKPRQDEEPSWRFAP